jgi:phosphoglycolate phosphatase
VARILLFDIDDTLISTGGAGRRAVVRALEATCGCGPWLSFPLAGRTDRSIVREALRERGVGAADEEARIDEVLEAYLRFLAEEVTAGEGYRVHRGVEALLDLAAGRERLAVGLGTGNIRRGAAIKLGRVALWERFGFGGFGCDHEDRAEILRTGTRRGAEALGLPVEKCRVVIIGDTPRDVAAALAIGAQAVGVATGHHDPAALRASGAIAAFADLGEPGAVEAVLEA